MPEAVAALRSDARVTVVADHWLTFRPMESAPTVGLIFYPGGRVDARAYAPAMHALAEAEYLSVVVPMPFNLAVFGADRAADVQAAFPEIAHWAVGGHSLGGAMAARFVHRHPDVVDGLALWACPGQKARILPQKSVPVGNVES